MCRYGLTTLRHLPPQPFLDLHQTSRYRRILAGDCSRLRNRIHKAPAHCRLRLGGALTNILGMNGRRILDSLSGHVRCKRDLLACIPTPIIDVQVWQAQGNLRMSVRPPSQGMAGRIRA